MKRNQVENVLRYIYFDIQNLNDIFSIVVENPQFLYKLQNQTFRPGQDIILSCRVINSESLSASWYRNDELLSEGSRVKITFLETGVASLTVFGAKPYDDGLYKCVIKNKNGKATTWARVTVGG